MMRAVPVVHPAALAAAVTGVGAVSTSSGITHIKTPAWLAPIFTPNSTGPRIPVA